MRPGRSLAADLVSCSSCMACSASERASLLRRARSAASRILYSTCLASLSASEILARACSHCKEVDKRCQPINIYIYIYMCVCVCLMSCGANGTQTNKKFVQGSQTDKTCFLHAKHSDRQPPNALGSRRGMKSAIVQQCCRRCKYDHMHETRCQKSQIAVVMALMMYISSCTAHEK